MLTWWEGVLHGLVMVGTGLAQVFSMGHFRPAWSARFALWRLSVQAESLEEDDDGGNDVKECEGYCET